MPPPALGTLLVRADGGSLIGAGHVMRCLALAEEWRRRGGRVTLLTTALGDSLADRWRRCACEVVEQVHEPGGGADADCLAALSTREHVRWTVIDGYRFGVDYQRRASAAPGRLMVIDDTGEAGEYVCDLVLNQNPHASAGLYARRLDGTRLLLGLDYCLLRREFADRRPGRPPVPRARRILVLAGGGDDGGLLADALAWLGRVSRGDLEVRAIVGPLGPPVHEPGSIPGIELTLVHGSEAIADEMARADAAVTAAGSACWELAYMGVPSVAVPVADNQLPSARRSDDLGAFLVLDRDSLRRRVAPDPRDPDTERLLKDLLYDRRLRESLALRAGRLVDGRGAARVVDALLEEGRDP